MSAPSPHGPTPAAGQGTVRHQGRWPAPQPGPPPGPQRAPRQAPPPTTSSRPGGRVPLRSELEGRAQSGDSRATRLRALLAGLVGSGGNTRELAEQVANMQRPVSTGRRIVVAAARGGAGRTTLTALMGTAFATRRADPVLVVDAAPWPGSLTWRLGLIGAAPLSATAPRVMGPQGRRLADLDGVLARTPAGLWCLPGGDGEQVPVHVVRDATRALSRLCAVTVTDTGEGLGAASTGSVLGDAHAVVLAAPSTPDGVVATTASLARLGVGSPGLLSRVVVVLVELDPSARSALRLSDAVTALASWGVAVLPLPHDRHLAAGAAVAGRRLAAATVRATHHICAETLQRAVQS